jgi:hypothetical protein
VHSLINARYIEHVFIPAGCGEWNYDMREPMRSYSRARAIEAQIKCKKEGYNRQKVRRKDGWFTTMDTK